MVSALGSEPRYLGSIPSTPAKNAMRNLFRRFLFCYSLLFIPLFFNELISNKSIISCFLVVLPVKTFWAKWKTKIPRFSH